MASSAKLLHTDDLPLWYTTRISACSSADLPPPDSVPCDLHEKSAFSRKLASDAGPSRNVAPRLAPRIQTTVSRRRCERPGGISPGRAGSRTT